MNERAPKLKIEEEERPVFKGGKLIATHLTRFVEGKLSEEIWKNTAGDMSSRVRYERGTNGEITRAIWEDFENPEKSGTEEYEYDGEGRYKGKVWKSKNAK